MRLCVCNLAAALARARVHTSRLHCVGRMPRMCTVSSFCITSRRSSSSSSLTHPLPLHVFRFRTSWTTSCSRHQLPERECAHHSPGDRYSETCTSLQEQHVYIVNLLTTYVLSVSFIYFPLHNSTLQVFLHLQPSPLLLHLHHHLVQLNRTAPNAITKCRNRSIHLEQYLDAER